MRIKPEIRILGIDDGFFLKGDKETLLVGVVFRGGFWLDGILSTQVAVDGMDATEKIIEMVMSSRYDDLRVIMLSGITVAGFNTIDITDLNRQTGLPVIAAFSNTVSACPESAHGISPIFMSSLMESSSVFAK